MDGLETRFPDDDKLSALCIFDFTRLPSTQEQWDASKTDFGLDEVDTLLKHLGTVQITSTRRYERFSRVTRWWCVMSRGGSPPRGGIESPQKTAKTDRVKRAWSGRRQRATR